MRLILTVALLLLCFSCEEDKTEALLKEAENYVDEKNYSSALVVYRDALSGELNDEQKVKIWRNLSLCFENTNEQDSAVFYRLKALKNAEKGSYFFQVLKGEDFVAKDKLDQAEKSFLEAEKLDEEGVEALNNLSLLYSGAYDDNHMNLKKALSYAKKAMGLKASTVNKEQLAAVYFQQENFKEAAKLYEQLFEKHPNILLYQFNQGQCLYFSDKEVEGIQLMGEAATRDSECQELLEQITGADSDDEK